MPAMIQDPLGEGAAERPRSKRRFRSALDLRNRRRRWFGYALFAASLVLMVNAVVGDNGYLATLRASREYHRLMEALEAVRADNARLQQESDRLRSDPAALEEAARRDLGLIRPGETLVIIKDAQPAGAVPGAPASPIPPR